VGIETADAGSESVVVLTEGILSSGAFEESESVAGGGGGGESGASSLLGLESSVSVSDGVRAKWAMSPSALLARSSRVDIMGVVVVG